MSPARGIDLPDLDLGVKSPSENYSTSEPFFSAYERLLGGEHDHLVFITDYQTAKKKPPLKLTILRWRYLKSTQLADKHLCTIALKHRSWLLARDENWAKRVVRFLAFVNQSDWRAKQILQLLETMDNEEGIRKRLDRFEPDFSRWNARREKQNQPRLPDSELQALMRIQSVQPLDLGIIDAADNWVTQAQGEIGRLPNDNEWQRFLHSPLDGAIGMSFALQWRYKFKQLFKETKL